MPSTERPLQQGDEYKPLPDEDGPHDVPDERVIERTLPARPSPEAGKAPLAD